MQPKLSDLLQAARSDAPAPRYGVDDVMRAGHRLRRRRRTAWAGAVALVAVAVIALPQLMPERNFDYAGDDFSATIQSYDVGPLSVTEAVLVSPGHQIAQIIGPSPKKGAEPGILGTVTVYRPGAFTPSGSPATVNGLPARFMPEAVAWKYDDDVWAVAGTWSSRLTREQLISVAAGLRSGAARMPKVSFRLNGMPRGYTLDSGGTANDAKGRSTLPNGSYLRLVKGTEIIEVRVHPREYGNEVPPTVLPADSSYCLAEGDRCYRDSADDKVQIEATGVSSAELLELVRGVTFAVPEDLGTWYPLTEAVR